MLVKLNISHLLRHKIDFRDDSEFTKYFSLIGAIITLTFFAILEQKILRHSIPVWYGWWDQAKYLDAANAFWRLDFSTKNHWYPPGYSLIAAPFIAIFPKDPFVIVDAICLLGQFYAIQRIAIHIGLPRIIGIYVFLITISIDSFLLRHFALPWTTTPTGTLILLSYVLCTFSPSNRNCLFFGAVAGLVLIIKPIDGIGLISPSIYFICCIGMTDCQSFSLSQFLQRTLFITCSFFPLALMTIFLHWKIYGWHLSDYEAMTTAGPVFLGNQLAAKIYSIFVDPSVLYGTFHNPVGLFKKFPYVAMGFVGMISASRKKLSYFVISSSCLTYILLYSSYYDFTPHNMWHFNTFHYFIWTFPLFGLFALLLIKEIGAVLDNARMCYEGRHEKKQTESSQAGQADRLLYRWQHRANGSGFGRREQDDSGVLFSQAA